MTISQRTARLDLWQAVTRRLLTLPEGAADTWRVGQASMRSRINITGALDDEVAAGLDRRAHEELEHGLGLHDLGLIPQCDAPQGAVLGLHGSLGELMGVHLPQALVTLGLLEAAAPRAPGGAGW